ncbi:hypothetical protein NL676_002434 [Syzygium grande]|nr:hypothetical protein NL676_002434 [Syzygium grande]
MNPESTIGLSHQGIRILGHMNISDCIKGRCSYLATTTLCANHDVPITPRVKCRPKTPFYDGEDQRIRINLKHIQEHPLSLHLQIKPKTSHPHGGPPCFEPEDAQEGLPLNLPKEFINLSDGSSLVKPKKPPLCEMDWT